MASMVLRDSTLESLTPSVNALLVFEVNLTLKVSPPPKSSRTGSLLVFSSSCPLAFDEEKMRKH
jgi:hypothetical protein